MCQVKFSLVCCNGMEGRPERHRDLGSIRPHILYVAKKKNKRGYTVEQTHKLSIRAKIEPKTKVHINKNLPYIGPMCQLNCLNGDCVLLGNTCR